MSQDRRSTASATPIAIIGAAALFPDAAGLKQYWRLLRSGRDAIRDVPDSHWRAEDYVSPQPGSADMVYCGRGGFLSPTTFDPLSYGIPPTTLEATDTAQLLGLVVGRQALDNAGYGSEREFDRTRASVIMGVTSALEALIPLGARLGHPKWRRALRDHGIDDAVAENIIHQIADEHPTWQENSFPGLLGNVVAGRIANRLNLKGTNCVVDAACASSLSAMHLAALELSAGRCDVALTGGVDTFNDIFMFMCFSKTQALSRSGDARPFAADADGTVLGEGIGMLVLKRLADAERDGDRILAVLKGVGTSSDGRSQSIYAPLADGQAIALRDAYAVSGVSPATVELVEAHGTGTAVGDAVEAEALARVYGEAGARPRSVALGSVKSQIGHTKSAAGAASMVKAVLALRHKVIPPTIKVSHPNPKLDLKDGPFYIPTQPRPWFAAPDHPRRAAVSSFGFGGSNFHAVLEEYERETDAPAWDGSIELIAMSDDSLDALRETLQDWRRAYANGFRPNELSQRAAESRAAFRSQAAYRLVLVVDLDEPFDALLDQAEAGLAEHAHELSWQRGNAFFGAAADPGALAFLFPGQGSQYVGMGRDLACCFPEARQAIEEARRGDGFDLAEIIFPPPSFEADEQKRHEERLTQTQHAQPALGAVSLAMLRVLERFGIRPDLAAGHSFGELAALRAAGRIGDAALRKLAELRGRLMHALGGGDGAMLAVKAPLEQLDAVVAESASGAVVANRNAPQQGVVSGLRAALESVASACRLRGWPFKFLNVSAAFHSDLMHEAQARFRDALDDIRFELSSRGVFANVTGEKYPEAVLAVRDLLARQITHPVQFVGQIRNLYAAGARTFIEVGPRGVLTGLTRTILEGKKATIAALDASCGRHAMADLARVVACVAAIGHAVELKAWEQPEPVPDEPRMAVQLVGANYRAPRTAAASAAAPREAIAGGASAMISDSATAPTAVHKPGATAIADYPADGIRPPHLRSDSSHGNPERYGRTTMQHSTRSEPRTPLDHHGNGNGHAAHANGHAANGVAHAPAGAHSGLSHAYQVVQEGLRAMQALQQQTAQAHERFLYSQEQAQKSFQMVIDQQRRLMEAALGLPVSYQAIPYEAPVITPPAPPPRPTADYAPPAPAPYAPPVSYASPAPHAPAASQEAPAATPIFTPSTPSASPAPAPVATPIAATPTPATASTSAGGVAEALIEVVSELTGYPGEMIELGMDLEADLGIDSIKRLEILGEMQRRRPDLGQVDSQYLGSLRTLGDIIDSLGGGSKADDSSAHAGNGRSNGHAAPPESEIARGVLTAVEAEEGPSQRPFDFGPGRRVLITRDDAGLSDALADCIVRRGATCEIIDPARANVETLAGDAPAALLLVAPCDESDERWLQSCFALLRAVGRAWNGTTSTGERALISIARLDGAFGLHDVTGPTLSGALAGLVKSAAHEWSDVRAIAFDVAANWRNASSAARRLLDWLDRDAPGEIGIAPDRSLQLAVVKQPQPPPREFNFRPSDVIIVSGGARGVTADCTLALARTVRATFVLLGRSPIEIEPPEFATATDERQLKQLMIEQARNRGQKPRPAEIAAHVALMLAGREVRRTLDAIESVGGRAVYRALDVRDARAVTDTLEEVRRTLGPIRGVVHGAGVLADRLIVDQSDPEFTRVLATKLDGAAALLEATRTDDLRLLMMFSSVAGRYGNRGQAAYAAANEALNKLAQSEARRRPHCRVAALNWGPWDGGMVTPELRREFERRGVGIIARAAGAAAFVAECAAPPGSPVEVVLGGALLPAPQDSSCVRGLNAANVVTHKLDAARDAFLTDHVVRDRAVLPLAVALDWMADAAAAALGREPRTLTNVRVLRGVTLRRDELAQVEILTRAHAAEDTVDIELRRVAAPHPAFRAIAGFSPVQPIQFTDQLDSGEAAETWSAARIYEQVLFHGPCFQVLSQARIVPQGMIATATMPTDNAAKHAPGGGFEPRLIDAALQLGLLWSFSTHGCLCLPAHVAAVERLSHGALPGGDCALTLSVRDHDSSRLTGDVLIADPDGRSLYRLHGVSWTIDPSLIPDVPADTVVGA